jgi:hypothetical protein
MYTFLRSWKVLLLAQHVSDVKKHPSSGALQWEPNCFVRTDGQTDIAKLMIGFHNFLRVHKNEEGIFIREALI